MHLLLQILLLTPKIIEKKVIVRLDQQLEVVLRLVHTGAVMQQVLLKVLLLVVFLDQLELVLVLLLVVLLVVV